MIAAQSPATKWRNDVAMGVSPWCTIQPQPTSPEGTKGSLASPVPFAPSGLCDYVTSTEGMVRDVPERSPASRLEPVP